MTLIMDQAGALKKRQSKSPRRWLPSPSPSLTVGSHVAIIGAGIAGAALANALAKSGVRVSVFEAQHAPATQASGNLAGNCLPVVDRGTTPYNQWYWHAWQQAYQWWLTQENRQDYGDLSAAFKWSKQTKKQVTWQQWVEELAQPAVAQWHNPLPNNADLYGVFFKQGGHLIPQRVVQTLLDHPNIRLHLHTCVDALVQQDRCWQLQLGQEISDVFDAVVIAAGADTAKLLPDWSAFLQRNKGQVSHLPVSEWQQPPTCVLSYGGYTTPAVTGLMPIGATFEGDVPLGLTEQGHAHNLGLLRDALPNALLPSAQAVGGHSAYRVMTQDHLPLVGQAVQVSAYQSRLAACALHPDVCPDVRDLLRPNLWLNVGHGARGLTSAFLSADLLRAQMMGDLPRIAQRLIDAVHPCRVIFRQLAQNALK